MNTTRTRPTRAAGQHPGRLPVSLPGLLALLALIALPALFAGCRGSDHGEAESDHPRAGAHGEGEAPPHFPKPRSQPPVQAWRAAVLASEDESGPALELLIRPGRALLPPGEQFELPVAIEIKARPRSIDRPPLDLSLVFDKSGSMKSQGKLEYTMQAARLMIENLSDRDTVSIVAYDTKVVVLDRQQPAVERLFLAHWTDEIEPHGFTNLSGGLLAGVAEIRGSRRPGALARVILLTDGLANRGVTDAAGLRSIAEATYEEGIGISTIGVGTKFDENILRALADSGGGSYAYVPDAEDIPGVVAGQIEGLLPVLCQNLRLTIRLPTGVELIDQVLAAAPEHDGPVRQPEPLRPTTIELGDLVPGEQRTVILHLRIPAMQEPEELLSVFRASIDYQLPGEAGRPASEKQELFLAVASSSEESAGSVDRTVMDMAWLADVFDLTYLALESRDWDLVEQAHQAITTYQRDLEKLADGAESGTLREHAALLAHYGEELERMAEEGTFHDHDGEGGGYEEIKKDLHYRRYLLLHHKSDGAEKDHD